MHAYMLHLLLSVIKPVKSEFAQFSKTKYKFYSSCVVPSNLMMNGWSISKRSSFSLKMCRCFPSCNICSLLTSLMATVVPVAFSVDRMTFP